MNPKVIDREKFDDAFQYFDKEVIIDIIDIFEKELPERLRNIHQNILENDFDSLEFNAHSLKGVIGTFMAGIPADIARQMEELARGKSGQDLPELFTRLESASGDLLKELTGIRKELLL